MISMQNEQHLQRMDQALVRDVGWLAHLEQHGQEIGGVGQPIVWVDVRLALLMAVGERPESRHLGDQPGDLQ